MSWSSCAPFVNRTALDALLNGTGEGEHMLVSRQEELDKLPDDALDAWGQVFVLSDAAEEEPGDGTGAGPTGLHAKMIAVERGWDVMWCVGSVNLTAAAFTGRNVDGVAPIWWTHILWINLPNRQFYYPFEFFAKNKSQTPPRDHISGSVTITKADSFKPLRVMAGRCRPIFPLPPTPVTVR